MNDLDNWTIAPTQKTTETEVPFGAIFKRWKRIKIKGWIWKQLQRINAGAAWGRARSAVAAASPPRCAQRCAVTKLEGLSAAGCWRTVYMWGGGRRTLKTQNSCYGNGDISIPNAIRATKAFPFPPWRLIWGPPPPPHMAARQGHWRQKRHQKLNQVYFWLVQKQQSVLTGTQPPVLPLTLNWTKSGLRRIYWSFENWQIDYRKYIFSL